MEGKGREGKATYISRVHDIGQKDGIVRGRRESGLLLCDGMAAVGVLDGGDDGHGGGKDRGVAIGETFVEGIKIKRTRSEKSRERGQKNKRSVWEDAKRTYRTWKLVAGALSLQVHMRVFWD